MRETVQEVMSSTCSLYIYTTAITNKCTFPSSLFRAQHMIQFKTCMQMHVKQEDFKQSPIRDKEL